MSELHLAIYGKFKRFSKVVFYRKSIKLEGEYWFPDPYQPLVERANLLKDYHRRDPYRTQENSEFEFMQDLIKFMM